MNRTLACATALTLWTSGCGSDDGGSDDASSGASDGTDASSGTETTGVGTGGTSGAASGTDGSTTGAGTSGGTGGSGTSDSTTGGGVEGCDDEPDIEYAPSGLPLMESNPGAPVALFLDYDGGTYHSSSDGDTVYAGYSRDADFETFNAEEQADIIASWIYTSRYFAMFDVNVTTRDDVRQATGKWGWILISEEYSGGKASKSSAAIGTEPYARAVVGSSTVRIEDEDRSRRVAHELGHNFTLEHSGVWDNGTFYKWEDWPEWDGVYGPIMGGGGKGERNGWSLGAHAGDMVTDQDTMEIIRQRVIDVGGSLTGWRLDDFDEGTPAALCDGGTELYRDAILGSPDDVDVFALDWAGGDLTLEARIPEVSAALIEIELRNGADVVATTGTTPAVPAGTYEVHVRSQGGYAEIGAYTVAVH